MKTWNTPELQELNLSNTAAGKSLSLHPDGSIYDREHDRTYYTFSGPGNNEDNPSIIIPDPQP